VQGYNTQVAVEPTLQLIVGQTVTHATNNKQLMVSLIGRPRTIRTETGSSSGRQWVLLRRKSKVPGEEKDEKVHSDRKAETRRTERTVQTGTVTGRSQSRRSDET
jgi:hypothetical protein